MAVRTPAWRGFFAKRQKTASLQVQFWTFLRTFSTGYVAPRYNKIRWSSNRGTEKKCRNRGLSDTPRGYSSFHNKIGAILMYDTLCWCSAPNKRRTRWLNNLGRGNHKPRGQTRGWSDTFPVFDSRAGKRWLTLNIAHEVIFILKKYWAFWFREKSMNPVQITALYVNRRKDHEQSRLQNELRLPRLR